MTSSWNHKCLARQFKMDMDAGHKHDDLLQNKQFNLINLSVLQRENKRECRALNQHKYMLLRNYHGHWSPTVPVSVWLPEPARDRGSKQETLCDDFYHTTSRSAAIFGVQTVLSYLVLTLNLWIGLCSMKWSSGVWSFGDVSVTYRWSFGNHTLAGALCSGNILPEPALVSQQFRSFTGHSWIISII